MKNLLPLLIIVFTLIGCVDEDEQFCFDNGFNCSNVEKAEFDNFLDQTTTDQDICLERCNGSGDDCYHLCLEPTDISICNYYHENQNLFTNCAACRIYEGGYCSTYEMCMSSGQDIGVYACNPED